MRLVRTGKLRETELVARIAGDRQLRRDHEVHVRSNEQPWANVPGRGRGVSLAVPAADGGRNDALMVPQRDGFKITGLEKEGLFHIKIKRPNALAKSCMALVAPDSRSPGIGEDED